MPGGRFYTQDGFENIPARLGLDQDNQLAAGTYTLAGQLTRDRTQLEAMYRDSWLVGRMVEVVAEDMVRGGLDIQAQLEAGETDALLKYMRRTGVPGRLCDTIKWSRLYGGALAAVLLDGEDMSTPLNLSTIQKGSFKGLHVLDRYQLVPSSELITELGPMLGYPEYYSVFSGNDADTAMGLKLHHSRCIRFVGVELPYWLRITELGWGASVVERAHDRILALDSATHGSANLMMRSYLRVLGIKNLREILAAGGAAETALHKMFSMIRMMQTNEGLTILDAEDTFQTHNWTFAGVYEALQAFCEQIAGATGIPLVRLLGQSPKGFSSGESDLRTYYDTIATAQDDDLRPAYEMLLPILSMSLWGRPLPEGAHFEFRSLWQPTETDKATIATADAQSVAGLFSAGLVTESEAKAELRDAGRITGRWTNVTDESIQAAKAAETAPPLPEIPGTNLPSGQKPSGTDEPTPQEISLNGAQVSSMVQIVTSVGQGQLPRESGIEMLRAAFPLSREQAEQIMGDMGQGFVPAASTDPTGAQP